MFRAEAINAQRQKLHGDIFLIQPVRFLSVLIVLVLLVAALAIFLVTGNYARSEKVAGHLVPTKGLVKLQTGQFGILSELYVKEGAFVSKGDQLAKIQIATVTQQGHSFVEQSHNALRRQKQTVYTQITLEKNQLEAETNRLLSEQDEAQAQIEGLQRRILLQKQITVSAEAAFKDVQELLGKGYISKIESERRHQTWLSQLAQEKLQEQQLEETITRSDRVAIRLKQVPNESKQRLERLKAQLSELEAREAELEGRKAYTLTAPVNGKIVAITGSSVGRTVQPQQPIFTILPEGSILEAEVFVPSRAAGFVEAGQEVKLLYDAFPYQKFGSFEGIITHVSETILSGAETGTSLEFQEPVYRVTVQISEHKIKTGNREISLQTGMTLQANIILENRSFIDWLLEPLKAATNG